MPQVPLDQLTTPTAGLFPEFEHFEVFAGQRPDEPYRWGGVGWGGVGEELPGWRKGLLGGFPTNLVQLELPVSSTLTWPACTDSEAAALPRAASVCLRSSLLQSFEREALLDSNYFFCRQASSATACCATRMVCALARPARHRGILPAAAYGS